MPLSVPNTCERRVPGHEVLRDDHLFHRLDICRDPSRQFDTARRNPGQNQRPQIAIALYDFVRHPSQRAAHRFRIEDADRVSLFC
jgi:hypothetical protein